MHPALRFLALAGALSLSTQAAPAPPEAYAGFVSSISAEIAWRRAAYGDPGISFALADAGGTVWSTSFGIADRNSGRAVDETTIFEMGSISKLFTCVAILQLQERGLVELDRPLRDYLPGFDSVSAFSSGAEAITVRMLMTHHAGLMMDDDPWETSVPARHFHRAVFDYIKDKPLLFPPGQRMRYSTFGVNLLGVLVEKVSGMEFSHYMREKILLPLEMPNASFDVRDLAPARLAKAYGYLPLWDLIPMDEIRPAGSLRAPVAEVAHFATMILAGGEFRGKRLLSRESIAEMVRIQNGDNVLDGDARVGLGFMAEPRFLKNGPEREMVLVYHFGQARTKSLLLLAPAWKKGIVISCNDYGVTDASYDLFSKVWGGYLRALFAEASQPYFFTPPMPDLADPGPVDTFAGDYATSHGLKVLTTAGTSLGTADGGNKFIPLTDGRFAAEPWTFPRVLYRFDAQGALATINGYPIDRWERLGPPDAPATLKGFAGTYEPAEKSKPRVGLERIELREVGGRLLLRPVRSVANETWPAAVKDPAILFPLRFLGPNTAEVVNGALSGFFGMHFEFHAGNPGMELVLMDRLGTTTYRQIH